jgi:O-antigen/teichoic acid export membrane protein
VGIILAAFGLGVFAIMVASLIIGVFGLLFQVLAVRRVVGPVTLLPSFNISSLRLVFAFGIFSWFQALAGIAFIHGDRLAVGAVLGTTAVAYYTICVQLAQPIHGFVSAALSIVFPNVSARLASGDRIGAISLFRRVFFVNLAVVLAIATPLILGGRLILTIWMGPAFASIATRVLIILAVAYAVLAMNITGHYMLLAFGKVRLVALLNVAGGIATLLIAIVLMRSFGLSGAAAGRLAYGPITLLYYVGLAAAFRKTSAVEGRLKTLKTAEIAAE